MSEHVIAYRVYHDERRWVRRWRWELVFDPSDEQLLWAVLRLTPVDDACETWKRDEGGAFTEDGARRIAIRHAQAATLRFYADQRLREARDQAPEVWSRIRA